MNKYLRAIGLSSFIKGFVVFFAWGFCSTTYVAYEYGLDSKLPKSVSNLLQEPLSLNLFGYFTFIGLMSFFIVTWLFPKDVDFENNRPKRIFWFSLPICECAIAVGIVIVGALLGSASSAAGLALIGLTDVILYPVLFISGFAMLLYTLPVMYFTLLMLDTENRIKMFLDVSALIYFLIIVVLLSLSLPTGKLVEVGLFFSAFMLVLRLFHKPLIKISKNN